MSKADDLNNARRNAAGLELLRFERISGIPGDRVLADNRIRLILTSTDLKRLNDLVEAALEPEDAA